MAEWPRLKTFGRIHDHDVSLLKDSGISLSPALSLFSPCHSPSPCLPAAS